MIALEMVLAGFVSKIISDCLDMSKKAIRDADKRRKAKGKTIAGRVYQVTIDALNEITGNKYQGQDILYQAAEDILRKFMSGKNNHKELVKPGLRMLLSQVRDDTCDKFLQILGTIICADKDDILYKEITLFFTADTNKVVHRIAERQESDKLECYKMPIENRAEEYAGKWDENVFLNNFNEMDEKAGANVKLKDIYLESNLPHFIFRKSIEPQDGNKLKELLKKHVVDKNGKKLLLILGQPGIGKSTLITWITANLAEKKDEILVYRFASDLEKVNWESGRIFDEILKGLKLKYEEIKNKVLILDGFDEIKINGDRNKILNRLNQELKIYTIITCRENYIYKLSKLECDYITLQPWNRVQIIKFCEIYERKSAEGSPKIGVTRISKTKMNKILNCQEVFGIPLVLYMVLALNDVIKERSFGVDVYDRIFSSKGGIISNRCIGIARYEQEHRIGEDEISSLIYKISQRIAFLMFEKNSGGAIIRQSEFKEICDIVMREEKKYVEDIQGDVLIGNYFKPVKNFMGTETGELQFLHRSIYEYFVAVYFFDSIKGLKTKYEVAAKLEILLKKGQLSEPMLGIIKYKFDSIKKYNLSDVTKKIFNTILDDYIIHYTLKSRKKVGNQGINVVANMLKIVCLWNLKLGSLSDNILLCIMDNKELVLKLKGINLYEENLYGAYLRGADLSGANLSRANLSGADLSGANLSGAYLSGAKLSGANLSGADLYEADLSSADLNRADLRETNLREANLVGAYLCNGNLNGANLSKAYLIEIYSGSADLRGANLSGAHLLKADLRRADLRGASLDGAYLKDMYLNETIIDEKHVDWVREKNNLGGSRVCLSETDEIISYEEYCSRKRKKEI